MVLGKLFKKGYEDSELKITQSKKDSSYILEPWKAHNTVIVYGKERVERSVAGE